jgi:hypothetical protein
MRLALRIVAGVVVVPLCIPALLFILISATPYILYRAFAAVFDFALGIDDAGV